MRRSSLAGRHVLVTGAAGGIGAALCRRLVSKDVGRLILVDRDVAGLDALRSDLVGLPLRERTPLLEEGGITLVQTDLASRGSLSDLSAGLQGQRLDVLVNNAGVAPGGSFAEMDEVAVASVFETNLRATVTLTHRLLPQLLLSEAAHIVNVASGAGLLAPGGMCAYAASKFGVVGFSEALRAELRGAGVGVSVACPPFVRTRIVANSGVDARRLAPEELARLQRLDAMVQARGISPDAVARHIIRAIERDRGRVVIGALPRFLLALRFFSPRLADWLNHMNYTKMKREGLL